MSNVEKQWFFCPYSSAFDAYIKWSGKAGLLNRTHVEGNRREMELALSDRGKALLDHMKRQEDGIYTRFQHAVHSFTEEQFADLIDMHQKIVTFFEGDGTR